MKTAKYKINGMHCESCKALIEDVCKEIKGLESCDVDLQSGVITISHDDSFDFELLKKQIEGLGDTYSINEIL